MRSEPHSVLLTISSLTVRDRDTMEQERIKIEDLDAYFAKKFEW